MSTIPDRRAIERRTVALIRDSMRGGAFFGTKTGATVTPTSATDEDGVPRPVSRRDAGVAEAVAAQALDSSRGGKRLRARLAMTAYACTAGSNATRQGRENAMPAAMLDLACAIEIFQTAALVHDDIIDESDLRRGKPSAHRALADVTGDDVMGRGLGLMLGDILATASIDVAERASRKLEHTPDLMDAFLAMQRDVGAGQVLDLAVGLAPLDDIPRLTRESLNVFRWKTASYTTVAPLRLGFLASGAMTGPEASRLSLAVGEPLGIAFQLADDLLDVIGSSASTGKPVGGDIREGKRTVLLADALAGSGPANRAELIRMFRAPERNDADVARAIALFRSTGAIERSHSRIRSLWSQAAEAIVRMGLPDDDRDMLLDECRDFVPMIGPNPSA